MTKMIVIIVAVVAVVAIAAFVLMGNNGGEDNPDNPEPGSYSFDYRTQYADEFDYMKQTRLAVLGNANNDTTIDSKDVDFIKSAIKGGDISYKENNNKYAELYMCDADSNGVINSDDVKFVQNMIDGKVKTIYYERLFNDGIGSYTPAKKTYLIPVHRCYARTAVLLDNASDNISIVGGDTQCNEAEFLDVIDQSTLVSVGTVKATSAEIISNLVRDHSDGNVVVMTGSGSNYCIDFESKGTRAQYLRFITWEGDALTGLLTSAYLIDGVGNPDAKDGTGWGQAKKYEAWYMGYINEIKAEGSKVAEKDKKTIIMPYLADTYNGVKIRHASQTLTMRAENSAENLFIENAGGKNLSYLFGKGDSYGRVEYSAETFKQNFRNNDLDIALFMGDHALVGSTQAEYDETGSDISKAFKANNIDDADIHLKTWRLNGIGMIIDQIVIAQVLLPDNPVIMEYDLETIWNEYLDIYGAPRDCNLAFDNIMIFSEKTYHVET